MTAAMFTQKITSIWKFFPMRLALFLYSFAPAIKFTSKFPNKASPPESGYHFISLSDTAKSISTTILQSPF